MKVIFFGLGSIGTKHASILHNLYPKIEIFAYRSQKNKLYYKFKHITNVFDLKFVDNKFDAAFICNPTNLHVATALHCLRGGIKNIFIEKPLSDTTLGNGSLEHYTDKGDVNIYIAHNLRFDDMLRNFKCMLDENIAFRNNIFYIDIIHSAYLPSWRPGDYKDSYSAIKERGGGVILDMSHEFDYIQWIFGDIEIFEAMQGKISDLETTSEDYFDMMFKIRNTNITGRLHLDYFGVMPQRKITAYYAKGQITANILNSTISVYTYEQQKKFFNYSYLDPLSYREQMKFFIEGIKNKKNISNLKKNITLMTKLIKIKYFME